MPKADHPTRDDITLAAGEFWGRDPHEEMAWMRANAPVYWDGRIWGITKYDDVKFISKNTQLFSSAGGIRPESGPVAMMIDMDDPAHMKRRKLVNKGFTPAKVRMSDAAVRKACHQIIDDVCERGECDFVMDVAAWLPMIMIGDALGVAPEDRGRLLEWSDDLMKALTGGSHAEVQQKAAEAFAAYVGFITGIIADRREQPRDDLMSTLIHAEVDGEQLDDDNLIHESLLILIGGDETTRHVITGGMYQLLTHPEQLAALRDDPSKIPVAVEEMLRWVTPIKNMARTVVEDTELRGQVLQAGEKLMLLYGSANRDEDVFRDSMTFDIERQPNDHLAFGVGTHFCLGNALARLELTCMFEILLERLPDIELLSSDEPAFRPANFVSGYERMPVRFTPAVRAG